MRICFKLSAFVGNHRRYGQVLVRGRWVSPYAPGAMRQRRLQSIVIANLCGPALQERLTAAYERTLKRMYPTDAP